MNDGPDEDKPDPAVLRKKQALGAAGDLSRMGIDPRSLGLGGAPDRPASPEAPAQGRSDRAAGDDHGPGHGGSVLPLRPEFNQPAPTTPVEPSPVRPAVEPLPAPTARETPADPARPGPVGRPEAGRLLRTVLRGLARPDAAEAMQDERALVDAVRRRQSERRIVTFVAGKGGVGCTTVALATATTLAALRDDDAVVIDVQQGTPSLGDLAGVAEPTDVLAFLANNEVVDPPSTPGGVGVVDGAGWDQGLSRTDVSGVLERLGTESTFNLLDAGDDPGEGGHTAIARADQVVVVTSPGAVGAAALVSVLDRVERINPAIAGRVVTVIVCPSEESHKEAQRELAQVVGRESIVLVPPDTSLMVGATFDPSRVSGDVREALIRIAAGIASGVATR